MGWLSWILLNAKQALIQPNPELQWGGVTAYGQGEVGHYGESRGLLFASVHSAGHSVPQYQPRAVLRMLEWLIGEIDEL